MHLHIIVIIVISIIVYSPTWGPLATWPLYIIAQFTFLRGNSRGGGTLGSDVTLHLVEVFVIV